MANHEPVGASAEASVGYQADRRTEAGTVDRASDAEHLAHPRTASRPFVADHNHIPGVDLPSGHRSHGLFFSFEHPRRSLMECPVVASDLDHGTFGGNVALEDDDAPGLLKWLVHGDHDFLAGCLDGLGRLFSESVAGHRYAGTVEFASLNQPFGDELDPASVVEVDCNEAPTWLEVADEWCPVTDLVELFKGQVDAGFVGHGWQVECRIG